MPLLDVLFKDYEVSLLLQVWNLLDYFIVCSTTMPSKVEYLWLIFKQEFKVSFSGTRYFEPDLLIDLSQCLFKLP